MAIFKNVLIGSICAAFTLTAVSAMSEAAKATKKDKRSTMSDAQKKDLRHRAREYCVKKYAKGTSEIESVDILSTGKVICWIRN
jgi:hypothetical protein